MSQETNEEKLARLKQELKGLKSALPEHCTGQEGYIGVHHASADHWLKIEEAEEQIKKLQTEMDA